MYVTQYSHIKVVAKKNPFLKFWVHDIYAQRPQNIEILVCTPHNYGGIVGGRDKNFEVLKPFLHRYHEKQHL